MKNYCKKTKDRATRIVHAKQKTFKINISKQRVV